MAKPKVLISRLIDQECIDFLTPHVEVTAWKEPRAMTREELYRSIADKDGLMLWLDKVDNDFLDHAPKLRVIAHRAAGFDTINAEACARRGIPVSNTTRGVDETTADYAMTLMLGAARRLVDAINTTRQGGWEAWDVMRIPFYGIDVHHKTLGIIGMGKIGSNVARRAKGFSMRILYYDIVRSPFEKEIGAEYVSDLNTLLRQADFISIHVLLNKATFHLIGEKELAMMKPTAILVNTARGPVIDQKALYQALKQKKIQAAAIDVTEVEPIAKDDPLLTLDNILVSPHIAGYSRPTRLAMDMLSSENLLAGLRGEPMPTCVNCHLIPKKK